MDALQILGALVAIVAALSGAIALSMRLSTKQRDDAINNERARTNDLIAELRRDIKTEKDAREKAERKLDRTVADLLAEREARIALRKELDIVCVSLHDLQEWKKKAQADIEAKERRIDKLERDNIQLREENIVLAGTNNTLKTEVRVYRSALALVGEKLVDREGEDVRTPEQSMESDQTASDAAGE